MPETEPGNETSTKEFGDLLRGHRAAKGYSQEALATKIGVRTSTIQELETDLQRVPYPKTLQRIGDGLGLTNEARAELARAAKRRRPLKAVASAGGGAAEPRGNRVLGVLRGLPRWLKISLVVGTVLLLLGGSALWTTIKGRVSDGTAPAASPTSAEPATSPAASASTAVESLSLRPTAPPCDFTDDFTGDTVDPSWSQVAAQRHLHGVRWVPDHEHPGRRRPFRRFPGNTDAPSRADR